MYYRNRKIVIDNAIREHQCCVICHGAFDKTTDITAEHLIPLRDGGSNELSNLGPAHSWCNYNYRKPKATFVIR
jgi:5-methylcytosine-specific restriction endonuclease McrA